MGTIGNIGSNSNGLDVQATVEQLIYNERAPERLMQGQKAKLDGKADALQALKTRLENLQDAVSDLKDFTGPLNALIATPSDPSVLSVSSSASALSGTHSVLVTKLATTSSWYSRPIADTEFRFAIGSNMVVSVGNGNGQVVSLDGKTLQEASSYINDLNLGVTASVANDAKGSRLTLVSTQSGAPGAINISEDNTTLQWQSSGGGENAQLEVDGVPIESATNDVSGVIAGLTFNLQTPSDRRIVVTVGPDINRASQAIKSFVSAYNATIGSLNSQFSFNSATRQAGVLSGDTTVMSIQSSLLTAMTYSNADNGTVTSLRALGISMSNDGTLTIDDQALSSCLRNNFAETKRFFQFSSAEDTGFAVRMSLELSALTSISGSVQADITGVQNSSRAISKQIDDFEVRIAERQRQLLDEYTRIDVMLRQFSATQAQISAQLESLRPQ